jgi:DNA-binding CsgD family transcriptional regulator/tetratricopeptide (TPR) repeat protein
MEFVSDFPRLAHHAEAAGDIDALLRYAPEAAKRASALGAHRQAAMHYAQVLRYADHLTPSIREEILALAFHEEFALGNLPTCIEIATELTGIAAARNDPGQEATWHAWKARALVNSGKNVEADATIDRALYLVENLPPSHAHAHVWQTKSRLSMLNRDYNSSIVWGERALGLARELTLPRIHAGALNAIGSSRIIGGDPVQGRLDILTGLEIARGAGLDAEEASLLTNLGSALGEIYDFGGAERYLSEAIAFTRDRDLHGYLWYVTAWLAMTRMFQGRWDDADSLARSVLGTPASDAISRIMANATLGRLGARRGDAGVWRVLDDAFSLAAPTGTLQRLAPVSAARAEAAWLAGDKQRVIAEARAGFGLAVSYRHPWHIGELGYWLLKAGAIDEPPEGAALPYALQMSGDWHGASNVWADLDCPYESARALADSGDEASLREAFAIFDRLGAKPAAAMTTRHLRGMGVESIPRGSRSSTRRNVALLTGREMEILSLLVDRYTNGEIAERLFLSTKTVERHVSSILTKLGVTSRRKVAEAARQLGIIDPLP